MAALLAEVSRKLAFALRVVPVALPRFWRIDGLEALGVQLDAVALVSDFVEAVVEQLLAVVGGGRGVVAVASRQRFAAGLVGTEGVAGVQHRLAVVGVAGVE